MKKLLLVLVVAIGLSACSKDTNDLTQSEQNFNLDNEAKDFLCGPGYHLEFQMFDELVLFKKRLM